MEVFPDTPDPMMKYAEQVPLARLLQARDLERGPGGRHFDRPDSWDSLVQDISERGIMSPVWLEWSNIDGMAYLGEGNTRLAVAQQLGLQTLPVAVYRKSVPLGGISRGSQLGPFKFNKEQWLKDEGYEPGTRVWDFKLNDGYVPQYFQPHYLIGFMDGQDVPLEGLQEATGSPATPQNENEDWQPVIARIAPMGDHRDHRSSDETWDEFNKNDGSRGFMRRLDDLPGVKRITPVPNNGEIIFKPGDRVQREHLNGATGTVLNAYPPETPRTQGYLDYMWPNRDYEWHEDFDSPYFAPSHDWTYDVRWDHRMNPRTYELEQPGDIGHMVEGSRFWPEGDVRLRMGLDHGREAASAPNPNLAIHTMQQLQEGGKLDDFALMGSVAAFALGLEARMTKDIDFLVHASDEQWKTLGGQPRNSLLDLTLGGNPVQLIRDDWEKQYHIYELALQNAKPVAYGGSTVKTITPEFAVIFALLAWRSTDLGRIAELLPHCNRELLQQWVDYLGGDLAKKLQYVEGSADLPFGQSKMPEKEGWHQANAFISLEDKLKDLGEMQFAYGGAKVSGYNGFANWDTWHTKLLIDNEQQTQEQAFQIIEQGLRQGLSEQALIQQFTDWAIRTVVGPHNQQAIKDAQGWNDIPPEERIDYRFEDLKNESPQAADIVDQLGFGPDVSDTEPMIMEDHEIDWQEIVDSYKEEVLENWRYEQGLDWRSEERPDWWPQPPFQTTNPDADADTGSSGLTIPNEWLSKRLASEDWIADSNDSWHGPDSVRKFKVDVPGEAPGVGDPARLPGSENTLLRSPCWCDDGQTIPHEWGPTCASGLHPMLPHEASVAPSGWTHVPTKTPSRRWGDDQWDDDTFLDDDDLTNDLHDPEQIAQYLEFKERKRRQSSTTGSPNHWIWLDGNVAFGGDHHDIADRLTRQIGYDPTHSAYISNMIARGLQPEGHYVAVGTLKGGYPNIWMTGTGPSGESIDRNAVWDDVARARDEQIQSDPELTDTKLEDYWKPKLASDESQPESDLDLGSPQCPQCGLGQLLPTGIFKKKLVCKTCGYTAPSNYLEAPPDEWFRKGATPLPPAPAPLIQQAPVESQSPSMPGYNISFPGLQSQPQTPPQAQGSGHVSPDTVPGSQSIQMPTPEQASMMEQAANDPRQLESADSRNNPYINILAYAKTPQQLAEKAKLVQEANAILAQAFRALPFSQMGTAPTFYLNDKGQVKDISALQMQANRKDGLGGPGPGNTITAGPLLISYLLWKGSPLYMQCHAVLIHEISHLYQTPDVIKNDVLREGGATAFAVAMEGKVWGTQYNALGDAGAHVYDQDLQYVKAHYDQNWILYGQFGLQAPNQPTPAPAPTSTPTATTQAPAPTQTSTPQDVQRERTYSNTRKGVHAAKISLNSVKLADPDDVGLPNGNGPGLGSMVAAWLGIQDGTHWIQAGITEEAGKQPYIYFEHGTGNNSTYKFVHVANYRYGTPVNFAIVHNKDGTWSMSINGRKYGNIRFTTYDLTLQSTGESLAPQGMTNKYQFAIEPILAKHTSEKIAMDDDDDDWAPFQPDQTPYYKWFKYLNHPEAGFHIWRTDGPDGNPIHGAYWRDNLPQYRYMTERQRGLFGEGWIDENGQTHLDSYVVDRHDPEMVAQTEMLAHDRARDYNSLPTGRPS